MSGIDKSAEDALVAFQQFHSHKIAAYESTLRDRDETITSISLLLDEAGDRIDALQREVDEWADNYATACESINDRDRSLREVAAERDEFHTKWVEAERIIESNARFEDEAAGHEPVAKSAVEIPRGDKPDAGEGRIIAFMPISELEPGMKFRLDNAQVFEEARYVEHDVLSESIFGYDDRASVKVTVAWGGSGHFRPERIIQVDTTPLSH